MPCPITHMYLAGLLAEHYKNNPNETVRYIHDGFAIWREANKVFDKETKEVLNQEHSRDKIGPKMKNVISKYRKTLEDDKVAVFSAFATGTQGPDLWVLPHEAALRMMWRKYFTKLPAAIMGALHFDLGHYNLTHAFPKVGLQRIRLQSNCPDPLLEVSVQPLDPLQRKYQTAYYLGYLSHIALDITGHIMVNVFAGAYFQLGKDWENEQGKLWVNIFNNHNKIEQYFDALVKFLCFEGYHDGMKRFENLRKNDFRQPDPWLFPNFADHLSKSLIFSELIETPKGTLNVFKHALSSEAELFLDLSVSLPGPFAERYSSINEAKKVQPFIWNDYCAAYNNTDGSIKDNVLSITKMTSEEPKVRSFRFDNNADGSFYYYLKYTMPNMAKIIDWGTKFYDPAAFARFLEAGKLVSVAFMDAALDYLQTGNLDKLELIRNWNLDLGLAIRIKDISATTDQKNPTKPPRPVLIDLVNVIEEIPALKQWQPPVIDMPKPKSTKWPEDNKSVPLKKRIHVGGGASVKGCTGNVCETIVFAESGLDIRLANFKLYKDADELGSYIFGTNRREEVLNAETAYAITECVEDFATCDVFADRSSLKVGNADVKINRVTFLEKMPKDFARKDLDKITISSYGTNRLPRHLRVTACRKYVRKSIDTGNFHADKFNVYSNPAPAEEFAFAVYALIKGKNRYDCLFQRTMFDPSFVESLKKIRQVGVNVILLIFEKKKDEKTKKTTLKLLESWIDGEKQPYVKV